MDVKFIMDFFYYFGFLFQEIKKSILLLIWISCSKINR